MKILFKRLLCTRNQLIVIGVLCELIWLFTLMPTMNPNTIGETTEIVSWLRSFPKDNYRNKAICSIETGNKTIKSLLKANRSMGRLIGFVGFFVFLVAYKVHRETKNNNNRISSVNSATDHIDTPHG